MKSILLWFPRDYNFEASEHIPFSKQIFSLLSFLQFFFREIATSIDEEWLLKDASENKKK